MSFSASNGAIARQKAMHLPFDDTLDLFHDHKAAFGQHVLAPGTAALLHQCIDAVPDLVHLSQNGRKHIYNLLRHSQNVKLVLHRYNYMSMLT